MCFCSESPAAEAVEFHLASHETQEVPMKDGISEYLQYLPFQILMEIVTI